tara:strand:- start:1085 stop:2380 length:1296 start_codon:yes stop_codon:yes gene_type:complete
MRLLFILSLIAIILLLKYYVNRTFSKPKGLSIEDFKSPTNIRYIKYNNREKLKHQNTYFLSTKDIIKLSNKDPPTDEIIKDIIGYYNKIDYDTLETYIKFHYSGEFEKFLSTIGKSENKDNKSTCDKYLYYVKNINQDRTIKILIFKPDSNDNPNSYTIYYTDITGDIIFTNKKSEDISDKSIYDIIYNKVEKYLHTYNDITKLSEFIQIHLKTFNRNQNVKTWEPDNGTHKYYSSIINTDLYLYNIAKNGVNFSQELPYEITSIDNRSINTNNLIKKISIKFEKDFLKNLINKIKKILPQYNDNKYFDEIKLNSDEITFNYDYNTERTYIYLDSSKTLYINCDIKLKQNEILPYEVNRNNVFNKDKFSKDDLFNRFNISFGIVNNNLKSYIDRTKYLIPIYIINKNNDLIPIEKNSKHFNVSSKYNSFKI